MHIDNTTTAILVDGGFYRRRAFACLGDKTPNDRAKELYDYCFKHLQENIGGTQVRHNLYRIFYYDCPPLNTSVYNPLLKKNINLGKSDLYSWTMEFLECLKKKRKVAIRLGELSIQQAHYSLNDKTFRNLCNETILFKDVTEKDLVLNIEQKGVDMRIGIDIASLVYKKQVDQIVLISGDSDFVPAAKLARREGVDFVLDPLGQMIKPSLFEHIDGLNTKDDKFKTRK